MPNAYLTLLDVAARNGDNVAAVVEDVTEVAPEFAIVPAITRFGTSYDVLRRVGYPSGGFRKVGNGVQLNKSSWERETKPMYVFDAQMNVGEDVVKAQTAASRATVGDILADEAMATVRGSIIGIGSQFYYGQLANANGFTGISTQVTAQISAGGANNTATSTSVYLCWLDPNPSNPQGVHFACGLDGAFNYGDWFKQQTIQPDSNFAMSWVNNFMFYLGLGVSSQQSVWRVVCVDQTANHGFTDAQANALLALVPLNRRNNLRWFMNRAAALTLQQSRATINIATGGNKGVLGQGVYPEMPTSAAGFPITLTDSLVNTETNGVF
jgi:hypothetical protein